MLPIIILFGVILTFGSGLLLLARVTSQKGHKNISKKMSYECGIPGEVRQNSRTPVKYYLTAISFIIFDIEIVYLFPWALAFMENRPELGGFLLSSMVLFMMILIYGLIYEWKSGGLEWD